MVTSMHTVALFRGSISDLPGDRYDDKRPDGHFARELDSRRSRKSACESRRYGEPEHCPRRSRGSERAFVAATSAT